MKKNSRIFENIKQAPLGIKILGVINCLFFGAISFLSALVNYVKPSPELLETMEVFAKSAGTHANVNQIKLTMLLQMPIAIFFIIMGAGLLLRKKWARKSALYFSFAIAILILLSVIMQPALIKLAIVQVAYPGFLIVYLTSKKTTKWFASQASEEDKKE
ncbi:MAG: hypothetical protein GY858_08725 [Candidatus Omnitrophica bacterium]|nr:hypothetical protein [Candidatus Omnitrophota bacterium]